MVVKTLDIRTPCYSDIYNIINNYTNTYYLYTLLFAKLYTKNVINKAFYKHAVASFMGAWIETSMDEQVALMEKSHPLWVRGLKPEIWIIEAFSRVASFMGAWIETPSS